MTETEVREVLQRLAQEKMSPKVGDVADIAGASESDVRRVLEELRAEQAVPPAVAPVTVPFTVPRAQSNSGVAVALVVSALVLLGGLLMLMFFSVRTVETIPQPQSPVVVETTPPPGQPVAPAGN